jgi:hypothetical protein
VKSKRAKALLKIEGLPLDRIKFPVNTVVKIKGIPFFLSSDTILLGRESNVKCLQTGPNCVSPITINRRKYQGKR